MFFSLYMLTLIKISFSDERATFFPVAQCQHHWWACKLIWLQWMPQARSDIISIPAMKWLRCYCQLPGCHAVHVCVSVCVYGQLHPCVLVNMGVNSLMYMLSSWKYTITIHDDPASLEISRSSCLQRSNSSFPCINLGLIAFTCWSKSHLGNSIHLLN